MTDWLSFFIGLIPINQYNIVPAVLSALIFLYLLISKRIKNFLLTLIQIASVFSLTLATEYVLIFLFTNSLLGEIGSVEKLVLFVGLLYTLLIVIGDISKGTPLGNWISKILVKFSNFDEDVIPISSFNEQLKKLLALNDQIQKGNMEQISLAYFEFTHIGKSIVTFLQYNPISACGESNLKYEEAKQLFQECDVCFKEISLHENEFNEILKIKTSITVSNFIGFVEGLNLINPDEKFQKE
jgi:hypothetical protein